MIGVLVLSWFLKSLSQDTLKTGTPLVQCQRNPVQRFTGWHLLRHSFLSMPTDKYRREFAPGRGKKLWEKRACVSRWNRNSVEKTGLRVFGKELFDYVYPFFIIRSIKLNEISLPKLCVIERRYASWTSYSKISRTFHNFLLFVFGETLVSDGVPLEF